MWLEDPKRTLDYITLKEMQFRPDEQLFIDAKSLPMPAPGEAWRTKAFLVDVSECQPTGDEAFIRRVEAVPMRDMFGEKSDPTEGVDALSHSRVTGLLPTCGWGCMTELVLGRSEPRLSHPISGTTGSW